jgi:hypothetical protein
MERKAHVPPEGPIRRPERGEWMWADKNSSRRMNSTYAPSPQPRIPTRACQRRVVTTDLPTLGTSPKPIQCWRTTQKARDLGNLESTRRTVRNVREDCPRREGGPFEIATRISISAPRKNGLSMMDPRTVSLVTDRPAL